MILGEERLLSLLAGAVKSGQAAGADEVEASYEGGALGVTRFANSYFTQAGVVVEPRARVRVSVGKQIGAAVTGITDPEGLAAAARQAVVIARHRRGPEQASEFARPDDRRSLPAARYFAGTAQASPVERAERLGQIFRRAERDGLTCAGSFATGPTEVAVFTSGGVGRYALASEALIEVVTQGQGTSGYAVFYGPNVDDLDDAALAEEACAGAVRGRTTSEIRPGPTDVVLAPAALAEALEWMALTSFTGRALLDGASLLAGRVGQLLCSPEVTIRDDAGYPHPQALPMPFDSEGRLRRRVSFIEGGRAGEVISDRSTARKLGGPESTGHAASVADEVADGPVAAHLLFLPGTLSRNQLIERVERGLYVTRFHYVNGYLDPRRAAMTGMTRDGTFLIENGRLGAAVPNLRFTESLIEALGRVAGVGGDLACIPSRWTSGLGTIICPSLLIRGFTFTGMTG